MFLLRSAAFACAFPASPRYGPLRRWLRSAVPPVRSKRLLGPASVPQVRAQRLFGPASAPPVRSQRLLWPAAAPAVRSNWQCWPALVPPVRTRRWCSSLLFEITIRKCWSRLHCALSHCTLLCFALCMDMHRFTLVYV